MAEGPTVGSAVACAESQHLLGPAGLQVVDCVLSW